MRPLANIARSALEARQDGEDPFGGPLTGGEVPTGIGPEEPAPSDTGMATPTNTGSSAEPTQTISSPSGWAFDPVQDAQTCEPLLITWTVNETLFTDIDRPMSLSLLYFPLNAPVPADAGFIGNEIAINGRFFNWSKVTVPAGDYVVQAHENREFVLSDHFRVSTGDDTSCIPDDVLSTGATGSTASTASTSTGTADSSKNTPSPIIGAVSSGRSHTAAVAGGVIGGIVGLALIILGAWYFLASRKRAALVGKRRPPRDGWGGLDSVDYKPTSSFQAGLAPGSNGATPRPSVSTTRSGAEPNYLPRITTRPSFGSLHEKTFSSSPTSDPFASPLSPSSHELARLPSTPVLAVHRSLDNYSTSSSPVPDPFVTPATTPSNDKATRRSSRGQRKPVPAYEPTAEELAQLAVARSQSESGRSAARSEAYAPSSASTSRQPSVKSGILSSSPAGSSILGNVDADAMIHSLKSKSSGTFEAKPMHYLMPDPPMPPPS